MSPPEHLENRIEEVIRGEKTLKAKQVMLNYVAAISIAEELMR